MLITLAVVAIALFVGLALLWRRLQQLKKLLETLNQDQRQLAAAWNALPADAAALLPADKTLLSVEILNAAELAARESRFAGVLGSLTPQLLRRLVYQQTADVMRAELIRHGVQAEVRLHGLA